MASRFFEPGPDTGENVASAPPDEVRCETRPITHSAPLTRVALLVGNGSYRDRYSRLLNPANDVRLIGDVLTTLGFAVRACTNLDKKSFEREIIEFGERVKTAGPNGIAFFYYSGHGIQKSGVNYMIPVDADLPRLAYLESDVVAVDFLVRRLSVDSGLARLPKTGAIVIALDACRDCRVAGDDEEALRGLTEIRDLPFGTVVAFATQAGRVADDGDGPNSPFAMALADRLCEPNARLDQLFNNIAGDVYSATGGKQSPAIFNQGQIPQIELQDAQSFVPPKRPTHFWWRLRHTAGRFGRWSIVFFAFAAIAALGNFAQEWLPQLRSNRQPANLPAFVQAPANVATPQPLSPPIDDPMLWPVGPNTAILWDRLGSSCPEGWTTTAFGCFREFRHPANLQRTTIELRPVSSPWGGSTRTHLLIEQRAVVLAVRLRHDLLGCGSDTDFETSSGKCLRILETPKGARFLNLSPTKQDGCDRGQIPVQPAPPQPRLCMPQGPLADIEWKYPERDTSQRLINPSNFGNESMTVVVAFRGASCPSDAILQSERYCLIPL